MNHDQAIFLDDHGDDIYGLWEVDSYFSLYYNCMSSIKRVEFLEALIDAGFIYLYRTNNLEVRGEPLKIDFAFKHVRNLSNWKSPTKNFKGPLIYLKESQNGAMQREKEFNEISR